jgi:hypothetical protein
MDVVSTEYCQIVQMSLVRRARYCAPIAEGKAEAAELFSHLALNISLPSAGAQPYMPYFSAAKKSTIKIHMGNYYNFA